ncbi:hypothetical protein, conserved [Plasmodium gonderi]|uniref:Uncharacterized protein n=1 Tax=Plasmodium gonderi TaxID=77519 RepID=A0A1Y1JDY5_PLAGO|nr:hypothetical protein, conserved [Plasmodium gonderi]GAW80470.1 hypothetical protein, conserved [Plasmodium gonderi]
MEGEVRYKRKRAHGNELSEKNRPKRKILFFHMVYLTLLFVACFFGGVLLGFWTTSYTPEINIIQENTTTFEFLSKNNKIIIGGKFNIKLKIINSTILSYTLSAESVKYFYYPVGTSHTCLLYNAGLEENSANQSPLMHKSEISVPSNKDESDFPTKLTIGVKYTLIKASNVLHKVPLHLGYAITNEHKREIQPLYNDCKRFNKLYFSIRLEDLYISNAFRTVHNEKKYELIFSCKCSVDPNVDSFFNSAPVYNTVILKNLKNDPSLLS